MNHFQMPEQNLAITVLAGLLTLALLSGCHSLTPSGRDRTLSVELVVPEGPYLPQSINNMPLTRYQFPYGKPNLRFNPSEMQISGFAGCNRYFGNYSMSGDTLIFDHIASTKKACKGVTFEQGYLKMISAQSYVWRTEGDTLILTSRENTIVFRRLKEDEPEE